MCYANIPAAGKRGLVVQRRWLLLQASMMAAAHHGPRSGMPRQTGGAGSIVKQCLCSPTKHPGSFRCRQHHAEYVWGGRFVSQK